MSGERGMEAFTQPSVQQSRKVPTDENLEGTPE